MTKTSGVTYMTFEHPIDGSVHEIQVTWKHDYSPAVNYLPNGDPGYPEESDVDWKSELTAIDEEPVTPGTEIPEWITADMIYEELDLNDYYDGYDD